MGITAKLKQISTQTLELLKQDKYLVGFFFNAEFLPESPHWKRSSWSEESAEKTKQRVRKRFGRLPLSQTIKRSVKRVFKPNEVFDYDWKALEKQFFEEWEVPELDLDKSFQELIFLLAGYISAYYSGGWLLPELKAYSIQPGKDFLPFLVINNSELDGRPLVNAISAGAELSYKRDYGPVRYLLPSEVEQVLDGLRRLTEEGFQERYRQESRKKSLVPALIGLIKKRH